ncbi:P-loop NTPase fold protein [Pseudomonas sp. PA1(2017)]|uniref:KAP family P-loop NTPase fold protein n=1 Tax=Pseudomonas sp. PA1(2017) TaxID=1932113 RepID=UPI00143CCACA|nr:P-loop NTPase fold protein [Pseudomonas sp. PA1(2017)]
MKIIIPPIYERSSSSREDGADFFKRQTFSDNLTRLFTNADEGLVVSIDAAWGDGKTAFVRKWIEGIKDGGELLPIYYDAYKNDFTSDAFLSIAVAIQKKLEETVGRKRGKRSKELMEGLKSSTLKVAKESLKLASGVAVSNLSGGMLGVKTGDMIGDFINDTLSYRAKDRLDAHLQIEENIEFYKKSLSDILNGPGLAKKIVFFVDELDRCRPNFSMEVIEKVKHLFSVRGVIFVLVINKSQILNTISHTYGVSEKDSEIYLQKFVHIETSLPSLRRSFDKSSSGLVGFLDQLFIEHEMKEDLIEYDRDGFFEFIGPLMLNLNPRSIERLFSMAATVLLTMSEEGRGGVISHMIFVSVAVRVYDNRYYQEKYRSGYFVSSHGSDIEIHKHCYKYLENAYGDIISKHASNAYKIDILKSVCEYIDMFSISIVDD